MLLKNCFSSQYLYEPGVDNDTAKRTGLIRAGIRSLPRELSYPLERGEFWHDKYDFIMFPNASSSMSKNPNEPFDKVGNVRLPTPKKMHYRDEDSDGSDQQEQVSVTAQTTLVNGQMSRSMTDLAHLTQRSASMDDNQLHWRTYPNPNDHFPSLPLISDASSPNHNGIHLFVHPQAAAVPTDKDTSLLPNEDQRSSPARVLLPDPILRLRTVIGLTSTSTNLLWTPDDNYVLYSSNAVLVQMHVESQQQWFFVGHTDKITAIAFNTHSNLLVSIQTGSYGK